MNVDPRDPTPLIPSICEGGFAVTTSGIPLEGGFSFGNELRNPL